MTTPNPALSVTKSWRNIRELTVMLKLYERETHLVYLFDAAFISVSPISRSGTITWEL